MSKYGKEILIGFLPVLLAFLLFLGIDLVPIMFVSLLAVGIVLILKARTGTGIKVGSAKKKQRSSVPEPFTFDDIGGQDRAKRELTEALHFLVRHEQIQQYGIRPLKGILLTGPPGTGKTLMAKAAAHFTNSVFASASGSEFVEMYVGVGASRIRDLFNEARTLAQKEQKKSAIIFIDEIDVIGGKRDGGQQKEYDQTLNQLLTEMDGLHQNESPRILLMAATNRKEMLDPALLRPGRFDRHIQVDLPDKKGRLHILNIHAAKKPLAKHVELDRIAEETFGFSGAELESVMNEGAIYAMREELPFIDQQHLSAAIDKVMMGEKTDRETTKEERRRVAIHELGHGLVAEYVRPGSVAQVSLSPRGQALGYVRHHPHKDQYLYTKDYLEQQIMIALGGAVAEEIFYGGRSTGSRNDFEQALNLVKTMVNSGLTSLGIVQLEMLPKDELLQESSKILDDLTARTHQVLREHQSVFERSLQILIDEEVLSGEKFRTLIHSRATTETSA